MGSITRSFANNVGSSGILTASAVTNATVEDVTSFDSAGSPATLVLLSTQTASNSTTISFTSGLDSTYDEYQFKFIDIHPRSDGVMFQFNLSTDSGANYNVTKTSSSFEAYNNEAGTSQGLAYDTGRDLAQSTSDQPAGVPIGNGADESLNGSMTLFNPSSTTYVKHFIIDTNGYKTNDECVRLFIAGYGNTTSAINAIRFQMSAGNFDGDIKLYGVKKS
jgi:hypothetical protein